MKHRILLIALLLAASLAANAQRSSLFDGGMMLHTGYLDGRFQALDYRASGPTFGIGGVLRFHLASHLRLGGEGYISTLSQLDNGSYVRISYGGLVVDCPWTLGRWTPYLGCALGGGSASSLLVFNGDDADWNAEPVAVLHNESFMMVNPYIGVEYALTEAVHLTLKADRLTPLSDIDIPLGARLYLGFIFCH